MGGPEVLNFYQEPIRYNYNFLYINCNKNYLINCVDQLLLGKETTMFANQEKYIIHKSNATCSDLSDNNTTDAEVYSFLNSIYPKQKHLKLIFKLLLKHNLINADLNFKSFPNIHVADFCSFITNPFGDDQKINPNIKRLCKYLQSLGLNFPKCAIKNKHALKLLN